MFPNQAMTEERIAEKTAQSNVALAATLAGVLHQFRAPLAPTIKLVKFMGYPMTAGDPTLVEERVQGRKCCATLMRCDMIMVLWFHC